MPSQPEAQGDILKEFREGTFLSSLDRQVELLTMWRCKPKINGILGRMTHVRSS